MSAFETSSKSPLRFATSSPCLRKEFDGLGRLPSRETRRTIRRVLAADRAAQFFAEIAGRCGLICVQILQRREAAAQAPWCLAEHRVR